VSSSVCFECQLCFLDNVSRRVSFERAALTLLNFFDTIRMFFVFIDFHRTSLLSQMKERSVNTCKIDMSRLKKERRRGEKEAKKKNEKNKKET
jgi:hypothetical protein